MKLKTGMIIMLVLALALAACTAADVDDTQKNESTQTHTARLEEQMIESERTDTSTQPAAARTVSLGSDPVTASGDETRREIFTTAQEATERVQTTLTQPSANPAAEPESTAPQSTAPQTQPALDDEPAARPDSNGEIYLDEVEQEILRLMNIDRRLAGVPELTMSAELRSIARYKSAHMLNLDYFSHTAPDGSNTFDWLGEAGVDYERAGENIAAVPLTMVDAASPEETARYIYDNWRDSRGHNANMMNGEYDLVGVGVALKDNRIMATQVFIKSGDAVG